MKSNRSGSVVLAVLAALSVVLAACGDEPGPALRPAATVGEAEISREQLDADVPAFRFLAGVSDTPCGTPSDGASAAASDAECTRLVLSSDIQEAIVSAYARAHDIVVPEGAVRDAITQLETDTGGAAALDAALADAGLTRSGLLALAERLLLSTEVQKAVAQDRLDEDALRALYEESKPQLTTVEVSHILLETRTDAQDVASEATPENFAELAAERSTDPGSSSAGGSLGSYSEAQFREQFDPTFVDAAMALKPGEISGVVKTQFGFHVIELVTRTLASFDESHDQLVATQTSQVYGEWLRDQYQTVEIRVDPRYGRIDLSTGQVVAA